MKIKSVFIKNFISREIIIGLLSEEQTLKRIIEHRDARIFTVKVWSYPEGTQKRRSKVFKYFNDMIEELYMKLVNTNLKYSLLFLEFF